MQAMEHDAPRLNTLTDHIGMFRRSVPIQHWRAIAWLMLALVVLATGAWELKMRSLGLRTEDIDDGKSYWAVERRKVDSGPRDQVVIIGDSRPLFDTNLDAWQQVSGIRPIQLALEGTPGNPFLHDLAEDEHFAGLVVYGTAPSSPYEDQSGLFSAALEYWRTESPSQRVGHWLSVPLQRVAAFLDYNYALFPLIDEINLKNRAGVDASFDGYMYPAPWKLLEHFADRQGAMWSRVETDPYMNAHAKLAWQIGFPVELATYGENGKSMSPERIRKVIEAMKRDVEKIRSRGGEVAFLRPPSTGPYLATEQVLAPRALAWDPLVRETGSLGIHFEDYPDMQGLDLVEWSHLSADSARKFTRAYVSVLCRRVPWLRAHGATCAS